MERIELSCHTKSSPMDGLIAPRDLIRFAWESGCRAIAITDFQNVRSFIEVSHSVEDLRRYCEYEKYSV